MIPGLFFDYLRSGDARPLKSVFYHNAQDVLALLRCSTTYRSWSKIPCMPRTMSLELLGQAGYSKI